MSRGASVVFALLAALALAACSGDHKGDQSAPARSDGAQPSEKPAPFDQGRIKVALIQYSGTGEDFEEWTEGARKQAGEIGFDLQSYDARGDSAKQASSVTEAIASGVKGILIDHGLARPMCPVVNQATDAGIPVVVYDLEIAECASKAVQTARDDGDLVSRVLAQMANDIGDGVPVGYVSVFGIAPFTRRDVPWKKFRKEHKWQQKFVTGKLTKAVEADNTPLVAGMLKANSQVKAIFAPYDELAKATLSAIEQNGLGAKVALYSVDISDNDIELMTKQGSPWKATAATDRKAVGEAAVRTLALEVAGRLGSKKVLFPGTLVTQAFLVENRIKNMGDLRDKLPALGLGEVSPVPWIGSKK